MHYIRGMWANSFCYGIELVSVVDTVNLITKFDPWQSVLCTCPSKLTFNPYTGCDHLCVYCYASRYIPKFFSCRSKKRLITRLRSEASKLRGETISIANSSDPYPNLEAKTSLTRNCLEILSKQDCRIQIVTKSSIVVRDIDLLEKVPSMVSLTITTDDDEMAKIIEPCAPSSSDRLKAARILIEKDIPISVRIDPVIPFVNDETESLVETLALIGVRHITSSTYKMRPDNWKRLKAALPKPAQELEKLYFANGERIAGHIYLPKDLRFRLMKNVRDLAEKHGMKFGTCREELNLLNTATCDGSWLLKDTAGFLKPFQRLPERER